jgi:hypothetical protein
MSRAILNRDVYRSSGGVDWLSFVPRACLTLVVSAVLAVVLDQLYAFGFYFAMIVPLVAMLPVAGMVLWTIDRGHCRNAFIGGAFGLLAGVVLYLGYYHIGMVMTFGPQVAHRIDRLPAYIVWVKAHEVWVDVGKGNPVKPGPDTVEHVFNWVLFAVELGFIVVGTTLLGFIRARRCYCERCGQWKEMAFVALTRGSGKKIVEAMEQGDLSVVAQMTPVPVLPHAAYTGIAVEHCATRQGEAPACPAYLSVREISQGGGVGNINRFDLALGRRLLKRVELTEQEIADLAPHFPTLQGRAGQPSASLPTGPGGTQEPPTVRPVTCVEVTTVPEPYGGRVLTTGVKVLGNLFDLVPVFFLFGGLGLAGLTVYWLSEMPVVDPLSMGLGILAIGFSVVLFLIGIYLAFPGRSLLGHLYLHWRARQEFSQRPDTLVSYDDPEAIFVEVVPRRNWDKIMFDTATDLGYLRIDEKRREILFEGDKERYRIPAAALIDCRVAGFLPPVSQSRFDELYMVVIVAEGPHGAWETPVGPRDKWGWRSRKKREAWATDLQGRILALMDEPT